MKSKVNIKTIAIELNLSPGTISRVLNGKAKEFRISKETVELVLKHAQEKGYSPNFIAKGLQASKTFTIGLLIPDIANPFFASMAKHIDSAASKANYSILLVNAEEDIEKEKREVKNLLSRKVDGIIAAPVGTFFEHFDLVRRQNIPLVFVDRYAVNFPIPFVTSDNYQGAFDATQHLIKNGHRKIALITGDEIIEPVRERKRGYLAALTQNGITIDKRLIQGTKFSIENGYNAARFLLFAENRPSAIFAMSNLIGLGVLQAAKEANLSIPEDLSIIVFDDQPYVSFLNPPITTVKQDAQLLGSRSMHYILKMISEETYTFYSEIIPTELIERKSVMIY